MAARVFGAAVVAVLLSSLAIAQPNPRNDYDTCRKASADAAIAACNRAIESRTFSGRELAALHNNRGWAFYGMGSLDRAIADYTEAIRINPNAEALTNRGIARYDKRDYDRALADTDEAIKLDPNFYFARSIRGLVWHAKGDFNNAIADYTEAIRLDPKDYGARLNRCWTRAAFNRDLEQALADCNEGLRLEPDQPDVLETRAFVYFRMGRIAEAITDSEQALKTDPRMPRALFVRGLTKFAGGDVAGANADVATAMTIQKDIAEEFARYGVKVDIPK
jgi:tetratricopeptide (TPR) repeat protein